MTVYPIYQVYGNNRIKPDHSATETNLNAGPKSVDFLIENRGLFVLNFYCDKEASKLHFLVFSKGALI